MLVGHTIQAGGRFTQRCGGSSRSSSGSGEQQPATAASPPSSHAAVLLMDVGMSGSLEGCVASLVCQQGRLEARYRSPGGEVVTEEIR